MTTQYVGFSILSAPLAEIDRRALSQAWYSALHLAKERSGTQPEPMLRAQPTAPSPVMPRAQGPATQRRLPIASPPTRAYHVPVRAEGAGERRAARSLLARRIERELFCPAHPANRATFSVAGSAARVHVSIQRERSGLRLVAVCSPRVRAIVARALEQARFALARRGIALGLLVKES
jgi:hypothetical protein